MLMKQNHHVSLRAMEPEDLDLLYGIENDPELWDVSTNNVPYSRYLLHDYIANASGDAYTDRQVRLIVETEDYQPVGLIDLINFDAKHCRAEVGIAIVREHRHQGYGIQALRQICNYALRVLHLHQLYAVVAMNNSASQKLFADAGFQKVGILPEWVSDGKSYHDAVLLQFFL